MEQHKSMSVDAFRSTCTQKVRETCAAQLAAGFSQMQIPGLARWIVRRGMEFASPFTWWANPEKTREESYGGGPHEGLDFAIYLRSDQKIEVGMENKVVSLLLGGKPNYHFKDLAGDTVIVASGLEIDGYTFIVQYSHMVFDESLLKQELESGTPIGTIPVSSNPKALITPHLHISVGMLKNEHLKLAQDEVVFDHWLKWDQEGELVYLDPFDLLEEADLERHFIRGVDAVPNIQNLIIHAESKEDRIAQKRLFCKNFPGSSVTTTKSHDDGKRQLAEMKNSALLISYENEKYRLLHVVNGDDFKPEAEQPLSFDDLCQTLRCHEAKGLSTTP